VNPQSVTEETAAYNPMGKAGSPLHAAAVSFPPAATRTQCHALPMEVQSIPRTHEQITLPSMTAFSENEDREDTSRALPLPEYLLPDWPAPSMLGRNRMRAVICCDRYRLRHTCQGGGTL
jgi:hypothetical protein